MVSWTDSRLKSFITSTLRGGFRKYPIKYECLQKAKLGKKINTKTNRMAEHYKCNSCHGEFVAKEVQVNHIEPVVDVNTGFVSWDSFIERLFCDESLLEVLCIGCHSKLTLEENKMRKEFKTKQQEATYQSWLDMKGRCLNPQNQRYYTHGARGITICESWVDSYDNFLSDMGYKPDGYTLDRVDNDGNYSIDNCKWSTPKEQALNRRTNIYVTYNDDTLTVSQWAEILGLSFATMKKRFLNWSIEDAIEIPKTTKAENAVRKKSKNDSN